MADDCITRGEHDEFCRRLEEHDKRQDARLEIVEAEVKELRALHTSIEKLAVNVETMANELSKQGRRLETLEQRDGEKWRKAIWYIFSAAAGVVVGFLLKQVGIS